MPTVTALLTSIRYLAGQALLAGTKLPTGHPIRDELITRMAVLHTMLSKIEERARPGGRCAALVTRLLGGPQHRSVTQLTLDARRHCLVAARLAANDLPLGHETAVAIVMRLHDVDLLLRDIAEQTRPFATIRAWWRNRRHP